MRRETLRPQAASSSSRVKRILLGTFGACFGGWMFHTEDLEIWLSPEDYANA